MRCARRTAIAGTLASFCLCTNAGATVVTFQVPDARSLTPSGINDKGQVTGSYVDAKGDTQGFLWQPDGTLATFGIPNTRFVSPVAISPEGVITGWYHGAYPGGFVRAVDGSITTFKVPMATSPWPLARMPGGGLSAAIPNIASRRPSPF